MLFAVTRPVEDAVPLGRALEAAGHAVIVCPMMDVVLQPHPLDLVGVQALLATSANGVRALAASTPRRDLPLFAVGPATANAARTAGFAAVEVAGGDGKALTALVGVRLDPAKGRLMHAAGSITAGDLKRRLEALGFSVERHVLYDARPRRGLPPPLAAALREGKLDGVLLFSPRTARLLCENIAAEGLEAGVRGARALCLSQAVAQAARALPFSRIEIAQTPDEAAMVALAAG